MASKSWKESCIINTTSRKLKGAVFKKDDIIVVKEVIELKIYFGHSKDFDFVNEFYNPIENEESLKEETLLFPHKMSRDSRNGRDFYKQIDLFIAEVSHPATGLGMELGWAFDENIPVYCFYRKGIKPSSSLFSITYNVIEYDSAQEMVNQIVVIVQKAKQKAAKQMVL